MDNPVIATDAPFPAALPTPRSPSLMSAPEHTHSLTSEERSGAAESLAGGDVSDHAAVHGR